MGSIVEQALAKTAQKAPLGTFLTFKKVGTLKRTRISQKRKKEKNIKHVVTRKSHTEHGRENTNLKAVSNSIR